jgi:hypothetical protein
MIKESLVGIIRKDVIQKGGTFVDEGQSLSVIGMAVSIE